jgi:hypothetical protein
MSLSCLMSMAGAVTSRPPARQAGPCSPMHPDDDAEKIRILANGRSDDGKAEATVLPAAAQKRRLYLNRGGRESARCRRPAWPTSRRCSEHPAAEAGEGAAQRERSMLPTARRQLYRHSSAARNRFVV